MSLSTPVLAAATLASAAATLSGQLLGLPWLVYLCKPLTTLLVIAHAWRRGHDAPQLRRWVLAGLFFSLVGDVALMWPRQGFLPGLIAFLIAHLCYLWAFTRVQRLAAWRGSFLAYALVAAAILSQLWPGVPGALRIPVVAYVVCLAAMAAQAASIAWLARGAGDTAAARRARVLALGGLLFMCSDALLATNKFATPLPLASLWILATYWAAQWCIASWLAPAPAR